MQLARRARARPDTVLSGNGAAGQPADSWSRWCAAFGPSWVCRSPCVPRLPAPLSPTLQGGTHEFSLGLRPRTLQDPPLSNAAPSGPLISPGLLWRSVVPPSPREGTAATQPSGPAAAHDSALPAPHPGPGAPAPAPASDWVENRATSLRTHSRLSFSSADRPLVTHLTGLGVSHSFQSAHSLLISFLL